MFAPLSCLCANPFRKAALLFGWAVFLLLAYKVSKLDREYQEYNPYEVLNLDPVNLCFAQSVKIVNEHKILKPVIFLDLCVNTACYKLYLLIPVDGVTSCCFCLQGASVSEIKKQYRILSLKHHPDKGGDEATFMRIAKAYAA